MKGKTSDARCETAERMRKNMDDIDDVIFMACEKSDISDEHGVGITVLMDYDKPDAVIEAACVAFIEDMRNDKRLRSIFESALETVLSNEERGTFTVVSEDTVETHVGNRRNMA